MAQRKPETPRPDLPDILQKRGQRPPSNTEDCMVHTPTDDPHEHTKQLEEKNKPKGLPPGRV